MVKVQPVNKEVVLKDDEIIVSKTDSRGVITYCNDVFIQASGYQEKELLGKPHNILRHPDMPKAVFKLLWEMIQAKKEINAYVKNLCKDGSYYWVFANVTPSFDEKDNIIGYFSVRRKPKKHTLSKIEELYNKMLHIERTQGIGASSQHLLDLLKKKGSSYEEFILSV